MAQIVLDTGSNGVTLELKYGSLVDAATGSTNVTSSTSSMKVDGLAAYIGTGSFSFYDSSNKLTCTGGGVLNETISNTSFSVGSNSEQRVATLKPETTSLAYGSSTTVSVTLKMEGIGYAGTMEGSKSFTFPRRPYRAPLTPTVRISAGEFGYSGEQASPSKDRFWDSVDFRLKRDLVWTDWAMGVSLNDDDRSFIVNEDVRYRGAIRARNDDEVGDYGYTDYWYGPTPAHTNLTAERVPGSTKVNLTWDINATWSESTYISRSINNGTWYALADVSGTTYTDNVPTDSKAEYHVFNRTPTGANRATSTEYPWAMVGPGYVVPSAPTISTKTSTPTSLTASIGGNVTNSTSLSWWSGIEWGSQTNTAALVVSGTQLANNVTSWSKLDLVADSRYRLAFRSVNPTGESAWVYTDYKYTAPAAPTIDSVYRNAAAGTATLTVTDNSKWASSFIVYRSTNYGQTYSQRGSFTGTTFVDDISNATSAWYYVEAVTPAPYAYSVGSAVAQLNAILVTDKAGIPGIGTIKLGPTRIRQVFSNNKPIWVDGD